MKLGRHADALADAQAAVAADGGYAKGYLRRALAHQALGGLEDAVRDFEKARDPTLALSSVPVPLCRQRVKRLARHGCVYVRFCVLRQARYVRQCARQLESCQGSKQTLVSRMRPSWAHMGSRGLGAAAGRQL